MVDFICKWLSEHLDWLVTPCDHFAYVLEENEICCNTCEYMSPPPQCWKRYFERLMKEAGDEENR